MPQKPRMHSNPEARLQERLVTFLQERGWVVEVMHGNVFQKGIPDLYLFRRDFGPRWVDVKLPKGSVLTKAQCQKWPKWDAAGIGIWILKEATDEEYQKLFCPPNWREMWKPRYDQYIRDVDDILAELYDDEESDDG